MYKMSNGNLNIKNKFQRDKKQLIADVILWIIMCIIYIAFWKFMRFAAGMNGV